MAEPFKLSPSDFAFLWKECPRCFYLKIARGIERPRMQMPAIFNVIDGAMKTWYEGRRAEEMTPALPPGVVRFGDRWVQSVPFTVEGHARPCFIRGKLDTMVEFDDKTYGVIDFKTSAVRPENAATYGRQLHAYAHALEHAAPGDLALAPITRLGLLVYEPKEFVQGGAAQAVLGGRLEWLEVKRDDAAFQAFLGTVLTVLERPEPPAPGAECGWCRYRDAARVHRL